MDYLIKIEIIKKNCFVYVRQAGSGSNCKLCTVSPMNKLSLTGQKRRRKLSPDPNLLVISLKKKNPNEKFFFYLIFNY